MFDLNDVGRSFDLKASKRPSQWDNSVRTKLERYGNIHTVNGDGGSTYGNKKALYNYAAWVDYEFHDAVFTAFEKLL